MLAHILPTTFLENTPTLQADTFCASFHPSGIIITIKCCINLDEKDIPNHVESKWEEAPKILSTWMTPWDHRSWLEGSDSSERLPPLKMQRIFLYNLPV